MTEQAVGAFEVDTQEVEYLSHPTGPLLATVYRSRGGGLVPLLVEAHGGAWSMGDRSMNGTLCEELASAGIAVAALDFRMPPEVTYPGSTIDINYAVRWFKLHAPEFGIDPNRVGGIGTSSGAHQVALCAMRPDDSRYAALPLETGGAPAPDARLSCLLLCWPVIDPLSRERMFREMKAKGPPYSRSLETLMPAQERYWLSDEAMADGTPYNIMERGEPVATPPAVFYQAEGDWAHPGSDIDRFTTLYRDKGGLVEFEYFRTDSESYGNSRGATPGLPYRATQDRLSGAERTRVLGHMVDFVHRHLGG